MYIVSWQMSSSWCLTLRIIYGLRKLWQLRLPRLKPLLQGIGSVWIWMWSVAARWLHEPNICHTNTITTEHVWRTWNIYSTSYWILLIQKQKGEFLSPKIFSWTIHNNLVWRGAGHCVSYDNDDVHDAEIRRSDHAETHHGSSHRPTTGSTPQPSSTSSPV